MLIAYPRAMDAQLVNALNIATARLKEEKDYKPHVHSDKCLSLFGDSLEKNEVTLLEIKQSILAGIAPDRVVATDKRIIMVRPSFWKLYAGHTIASPTEVSYVPYHNLISVITTKGRIFATVHMRIHGFADESREMKKEGQINGVPIAEATRFTRFLEDIIEALAGDRGDSQGGINPKPASRPLPE